MFRLIIIISLISFSLAIAGCTRQSDSPQKVEGSTPTAAEPTNPESMHDSIALKPNQGLAESDPFVIDVDVNAEIGGVVRCVFQDSRGVLWVGTLDGAFRFDGTTFTNFAIPEAEPDPT